jgi:nucleoside-diphosphate-sugar epimerase
MKVAIAGASGFIGKVLMNRLQQDSTLELRPLARTLTPPCDLFSLLDVEKALQGQEQAIYLVHSMLPSSQLSQGNFSDYDLILADNFARAAKKNGLKRIIYLGGIIPKSYDSNPQQLSEHLKSRLEVEEVFKSYGIPLLALRAGIVMGAEGSSFGMLLNLVKRLPLMICPSWTRKHTAPIHVDDVAESFYFSLKNENLVGAFDLAGPELLTYLEMLQAASKKLNKNRVFLNVPIFSPSLSKLWVKTVTGAPKNLVYPLIDSLKHDMKPNPESTLHLPNWKYKTLSQTLDEILILNRLLRPKAYSRSMSADRLHVVQSVQRHRMPLNKNIEWASLEYISWLNKVLAGMVTVKTENDKTRFFISGTQKVLLELTLSKDRSFENRNLFYITSGLLDAGSKRGRLEFRLSPDGAYLITAIHDFRPRLPWYLYKYSQAIVHSSVMRRFGQHLDSLADESQNKRREPNNIS